MRAMAIGLNFCLCLHVLFPPCSGGDRKREPTTGVSSFWKPSPPETWSLATLRIIDYKVLELVWHSESQSQEAPSDTGGDALITPGIFWEISSLKPDEATHSFRLEAGNLAVANMKDENWGLWGRSWEENPILSLWNCHFLLLSQLKFG